MAGGGRVSSVSARVSRRQLDAGDGHPAFRERHSHAAGPYSELKRPPGTGELGEAIHRRPQHFRREHAGAWRVIALGGIGVPDLPLSHAANDSRERRGKFNAFAVVPGQIAPAGPTPPNTLTPATPPRNGHGARTKPPPRQG